MNGLRIVLAALIAFSLGGAVTASAQQPCCGNPGGAACTDMACCGPSGYHGRGLYDPASVTTVKGRVVTLGEGMPCCRTGGGVHLMLLVRKDSIPVHLGPSRYIEEQGMRIGPGDQLEVAGSRVPMHGRPVIIAAEVIKGNKLLPLRNEAGIPYWQTPGDPTCRRQPK